VITWFKIAYRFCSVSARAGVVQLRGLISTLWVSCAPDGMSRTGLGIPAHVFQNVWVPLTAAEGGCTQLFNTATTHQFRIWRNRHWRRLD